MQLTIAAVFLQAGCVMTRFLITKHGRLGLHDYLQLSDITRLRDGATAAPQKQGNLQFGTDAARDLSPL